MNPALWLLAVAAPLAAVAAWRNARPSPRGVAWTAAAAMTTAASLAFESAWLVTTAGDAILAAAALYDLIGLPRLEHFSFQRLLPPTVSLRRRHVVRLVVEYVGPRPLSLVVRDGLDPELQAGVADFQLALPPRGRAEMEYVLTPSRRGRFSFDAVYFQASSRLGLWSRTLRAPLPDEIQVYPNLRQMDDFAILSRCDRLNLLGVRRIRKPGQEDDFERLRDYTLDDDYRHIDWRSTARRNQLIVREFRSTRRQRLMLALDAGRMMSSETEDGVTLFDHSLNAALLLAFVALRQGDEVGLLCFSDAVHGLAPPAGGAGQMNRLLHVMYDQFPRLVESRPREAMLQLRRLRQRRSLVVWFSNLADEAAAARLQAAHDLVAARHLSLGVFLREPRLFDALRGAAVDAEPARAAAAASLIHWRWSVLCGLRRRGALVLDAAPDELAPALVNQYLEIKARGRL